MPNNRPSVTVSTVSSKSYPKTSFNTILILTDKASFTEDFKSYQNLNGFLEDNTHADLAQAGNLIFMQEPRVITVIVVKTDDTNTDIDALVVKMVDLNSILNSDFFTVGVVSDHSDDQLIELAKYIETQEVLFSAYTADISALATTELDLASRVKNLNLRHTFVNYHATQRLDFAFISRFLGEKIGSTSAKFLSLKGINSSNLSYSETTNILNKNANIYDRERKKYTFTKQGTTASNENIKSVTGELFVSTTCIEAVYEILLNNSNISFNSKDIKKLTTAIDIKLRIAQKQNIIAEDNIEQGPSFLIEATPSRAESKIEFDIKYLEAGTVKFVDLKFTAFKEETQFNLERNR